MVKGIWAAFRDLKDELEIGPIYHWTERRIQAHVFICFLALILKLTLKKKLRGIDPDISYNQVMADVKKVKANEFRINRHKVIMRTDFQGKASLAFKAAGINLPSRILDYKSSKSP